MVLWVVRLPITLRCSSDGVELYNTSYGLLLSMALEVVVRVFSLLLHSVVGYRLIGSVSMWRSIVAGCVECSGNYHKAVAELTKLKLFPICSDTVLGIQEITMSLALSHKDLSGELTTDLGDFTVEFVVVNGGCLLDNGGLVVTVVVKVS
nr:hypothetical protein [Tanacetum cinerariifolium]